MRESRRRRQAAQTALGAMAAALALAACGGGGTHFADIPRPPVPVDLSVYVDNQHVSVSPAKVGAGPVILIVTNQASGGRNVKIQNIEGTSVGTPTTINSGQTAQITATLKTGSYEVAAGASTPPAKLTVGTSRANADNVLLQP